MQTLQRVLYMYYNTADIDCTWIKKCTPIDFYVCDFPNKKKFKYISYTFVYIPIKIENFFQTKILVKKYSIIHRPKLLSVCVCVGCYEPKYSFYDKGQAHNGVWPGLQASGESDMEVSYTLVCWSQHLKRWHLGAVYC